jgi:hypothetical protein
MTYLFPYAMNIRALDDYQVQTVYFSLELVLETFKKTWR